MEGVCKFSSLCRVSLMFRFFSFFHLYQPHLLFFVLKNNGNQLWILGVHGKSHSFIYKQIYKTPYKFDLILSFYFFIIKLSYLIPYDKLIEGCEARRRKKSRRGSRNLTMSNIHEWNWNSNGIAIIIFIFGKILIRENSIISPLILKFLYNIMG